MSKIVPIVTLLAALSGATGLLAENATPTPTPTPSPVGEYKLQNRSTFVKAGEGERAPFWPIGWTKPKAGAPVVAVGVPEAPRQAVDASSFKVTSVLVGNPSLAIINGRTYSEGEVVRTPHAVGTGAAGPVPMSERVRVYRIADGAVTLQHQGELITVALQRPELVKRTEAMPELSSDR